MSNQLEALKLAVAKSKAAHPQESTSSGSSSTSASVSVSSRTFGTMHDGREVKEFTLSTSLGLTVSVIEYGAALSAVCVPYLNQNGELVCEGPLYNVILSFDTLEEFQAHNAYFGATVGRVASRISGASFDLDGTTYSLNANNGEHTLHGGTSGFNDKVWTGVIDDSSDAADSASVTFTYTSPDGEEGFPATLETQVRYTLTTHSDLTIEFTATSDGNTPVSLTNHAYWNLNGAASSATVDRHQLYINSAERLELDDSLLPTGELVPVHKSAYDFHTITEIGYHLDAHPAGFDSSYVLERQTQTQTARKPTSKAMQDLLASVGLDHSKSIQDALASEEQQDDAADKELVFAASVRDPITMRRMDVLTTHPTVHLYTAGMLKETNGAQGAVYGPLSGMCLECQSYINAVNVPSFPSIILSPGTPYTERTVHTFFWEE